MNIKVNDVVRVRVTDITDDRVLARLLFSDQQCVMLHADITKNGDIRKFVRPGRNEVVRVKSITDGIVYVAKNTVSPEEIYAAEKHLYRCSAPP
ncbi:hypothetical protein SAGO17_0055 [Mimivirus AB-566-O17]|uniref:S1 motif domain-containing protein n=1 Tax=Mimivirus AB-566-O17 TaxID=1988039 RepID=A0A1X9VNR5_9VIRU|nr:hypothetical protein SAGO17_0055 [Mimivirus AB-566-O17]